MINQQSRTIGERQIKVNGGQAIAWIKVIDETEAMGKLRKIYQELKKERGKIANIMRVQSLNPPALEAHMSLYLRLMFGESGLTHEERELIATLVSAANKCKYCVNHHGEALNHYYKDSEKLQRLIQDYRSLQLPKRMLKMLDYVVKLTKAPDKITQADIESLHQCGFTDESILDMNLIVSYFNFVNRIALGLGVEFTPEEVRGYNV